ncbi:MAG: sigma-54-dependent Fis family transcriptional regulator [Chitinophagaceae bacterium]|nr:sigma-54-dependent Fis family transcriptional regulator [Chitinophagaceae bacterium]
MTQISEGKILIIDDDPGVLSAAYLLLKRHFKQTDTEKNPLRIPYWVNTGKYDVILLDMNFNRDLASGKEGFEWLDKILDMDPTISVVLFTAYGDVEMAVSAIKLGATDFVLKPWDNDKLISTLVSAYEKRNQKLSIEKKPAQTPKQSKQTLTPLIIGESEPIKRVIEIAELVASTEGNVLIHGENGTGKDVLARYIHTKSLRNAKPFVAVDLGAIPETLFESELFGYIKGAFTDARDDRAGRFEEAKEGTIFLDEVGNITLQAQAKLLSVLQNREVTPLGSNKSKPVDVRLICATNKNLAQMVANQSFRQDLLYRINTIEIQMPALRERGQDIELLATHFMNIYSQKYNRTIKNIHPDFVAQMLKYSWPGNVRELQHTIERSVILCKENILLPVNQSILPSIDNENLGDLKSMHLEEVEKFLINKALIKHSGNITETAKELGLTRASLYRRLEKHGI